MDRGQDMSSSLYNSRKEGTTHQPGEIQLQRLHKHVDEREEGECILELKQTTVIHFTAVNIRRNHVHQVVHELVDTSVAPVLKHIALE